MTREHRELLTVDEIVAFEFLCRNETCRAKIVLPADGGIGVPDRCQHCGRHWFVPTPEGRALYESTKLLAQAMADLKRLRDQMGCILKLEIKGEKTEEND